MFASFISLSQRGETCWDRAPGNSARNSQSASTVRSIVVPESLKLALNRSPPLAITSRKFPCVSVNPRGYATPPQSASIAGNPGSAEPSAILTFA